MDQSTNENALGLLRDSIDTATAFTPTEKRELRQIDLVAVRMHWGTVQSSSAIALLLASGLPAQAAILQRSLRFEVHRLIYLDQNQALKDRLLLGHMEQSARKFAKLAEQAHEEDGGELLFAAMKKRVKELKAKAGVTNCDYFPAEGRNIAASIGREDDVFGYELFSVVTHGPGWALPSVKSPDDGSTNLGLQNYSPLAITAVAAGTSELLLEGTKAMASLYEWENTDQLRDFASQRYTDFEVLLSSLSEDQ